MIHVTLVYEDGSTWFAGGFNSMDEANAWILNERKKPYWKETTEAKIVDTSPPI